MNSTVAFGGFAGAQQTVDFAGQAPAPASLTLQLDTPLAFLVRIEGLAGSDHIAPSGVDAVADGFQNGVLTLFGPDHVLEAALRYAGSYTTGNFTLSHAGGGTMIGHTDAATAQASAPAGVLHGG